MESPGTMYFVPFLFSGLSSMLITLLYKWIKPRRKRLKDSIEATQIMEGEAESPTVCNNSG